jgi:hypothetical protein
MNPSKFLCQSCDPKDPSLRNTAEDRCLDIHGKFIGIGILGNAVRKSSGNS